MMRINQTCDMRPVLSPKRSRDGVPIVSSMFDAFDLDHDGEVRSYEFLAARRLDQFKDIDAPTTSEQRMMVVRLAPRCRSRCGSVA